MKPTLTQIEFNHIKHFDHIGSMARPMFNQLEPYQVEMLGNGCGPKGWGTGVPDWGFTRSCNEHDFAYWRGGTADDRKWADETLLWDMLYDAKSYRNPLRKWFRYGMAWGYYFTIRMFGGLFWDYRPANARVLLEQTLEYYGYAGKV